MALTEDSFLVQLRSIFRIEAQEHIQVLSQGLQELAAGPDPVRRQNLVQSLFRAAHSLKGAARAVDLTDIESLCQLLEDTLAGWTREPSGPTPAQADGVRRKLDAIDAILAPPTAAPHEVPPEPGSQTVRVAIGKLEARLLEAQEMLGLKIAMERNARELREFTGVLDAWQRAWLVAEADVHLLRHTALARPEGYPARAALLRLLDFCAWNERSMRSMGREASGIASRAQHDFDAAARQVDELLENAKTLLMLPFSSLGAALPRLVRDLCRDQEKQADFTLHGEHIEIDKRILEEMKDPLLHLLRNAVDHAVEPAQVRRAQGKPVRAAITLAVSPLEGHKVELLLSDDGAGIDSERVRQLAVERGLVAASEAAALDEAAVLALIFRAGMSTNATVTPLSGRGLGLAIASEKAESLGGSISVRSQRGQGTTFRIVLPLTQATFRGIVLRVEDHFLVAPTTQVERVAWVHRKDVQTLEGRDTVVVNGRAVALVRLADLLELPVRSEPAPPGDGSTMSVVLAGGHDRRVAFIVDAVLDEQEILAKPLGSPLVRVRNISAATVLASGQVAPILRMDDLLRSARRAPVRPLNGVTQSERPRATRMRAILVAEDSITSRLLLKSILESAGYRVKTAVDGMEAFAMLRSETFDLLVTDVEMPRLNGFDLTLRIRADRALASLPVVMVTALATPQDLERGFDVGANAYVAKGNFNQDTLLDAVERLL